MTDERFRSAAWLQLFATIVLFGLLWPILKIGLEFATPVWLAAARATLSGLAAFALLALLGRLRLPHRADWPVILSVGTLQLCCFFALANLGVQSVPPGRSSVLAYTTPLWMVPLALLVGEKVGWRGLLGVLLGAAGIALIVDLDHFAFGHAYLLAAGLSWALAMLHTRRHRWQGTPLDLLPWQMTVATLLLWTWALIAEPDGYLELGETKLWLCLLYIGVLAGPTATWAAISVARALPPITSALGMLGVPMLGIASSVVILGEAVTVPLALGAALVLAGMAVVILERAK